MTSPRRRALLAAAGASALWLAGCATPAPPAATTADGGRRGAWSGRLSLRVDSEPAQSFAALFELRGSASAGELTLTTPIGNTLGVVRWSGREALLRDGGQERRYESLDRLIEAVTGAAIPVPALFDWLAGRDTAVPGWRPNLSQAASGRLQAVRESPRPTAELRVVFEPATP